eukprot:14202370-Ditylum_brightwellii.AAC.1
MATDNVADKKKAIVRTKPGARIFQMWVQTAIPLKEGVLQKKQGPSLTGFFGQKAAQKEDFDYSRAMESKSFCRMKKIFLASLKTPE